MYDESVMDPGLAAHVPELRDLLKGLAQLMPNGVDVGTPERLAEVRGAMSGLRAGAQGSADAPGAAGDPAAAGVFEIPSVEGAEDVSIEGPEGALRLHVLRPPEIHAVYLHIHGGGWTLGLPEMNDASNWQLAQAAGVAVVSVDYRLAPEAPYPAGPDDCEAAAVWLLRNARSEFGTDRLLIGGESAGAHLSAVTLLRMRDKHDAIAHFEGANLVYGAYDLGMTPSQRAPGYSAVLSAQDLRDMPGYFLPKHDLEARRDPAVSPLYAELSFLPPALFSVGTRDRLLDDSLFMSARWCTAGNRTELALYPEAPHGFTMLPIAMARAAHARIERFVSEIATPAAPGTR